MVILDRLLGRKAIKEAAPVNFGMMWTGGGFTMIPYSTTAYIKDGYNGNSAVYTVVTALMQKFSQIPFYVYRVKKDTSLKHYKAISSLAFNERAIMLKAAAMDEMPHNHPLSQLMAKPNSYQSDAEFRQMAMCFLKLTGISGIYANKGVTGTNVQSLHILPSQWISLKPEPNLMDFEKVYFSPMGAFYNELPKDQVYLWKYANPDFQTDGSHLYGLSPLKAGLMDVKASNEASKQMAKMYENGGARGILTPKEIITKEQVSMFRDTITTWLTGSDNRGKIGGISAPVDFHNIGLDAVDMGLINGKNISDERIALIFGYPPELLKADNKYDNAINALRKLVTNGIYSDLVSYRHIWNNWLLPMMGYDTGEYYVDFDITILPEMQEDMAKVVEQADKMWWISPNEKREMSKYDAIADPAMDKVYIPSNLVPIDDFGESLNSGDYDNSPN
jgi:HK97 family phage portal protein